MSDAMSTQVIWQEILHERERQIAQWGGVQHDDRNGPNDWIAFICYHSAKGSYKGDFRKQMIRVAALAVAAIEWFDRRK